MPEILVEKRKDNIDSIDPEGQRAGVATNSAGPLLPSPIATLGPKIKTTRDRKEDPF